MTAHVERLNKSHFSEIELGTHSYCGYLKVYCPKIWSYSDKNYIFDDFFTFILKFVLKNILARKHALKFGNVLNATA